MINDVISLAMDRAVVRCGDRKDGIFTAANFSTELMTIAGLEGVIDGRLVRTILTGRLDVEPLGDGMFRKIGRCST